jgi:hypothetical protein
MKYLKLSILIIAISLGFASCTKTSSSDQATSEDIRHADLAVSDVFTFSTSETGGSKAMLSDTTSSDTTGMHTSVRYDSASKCWITVINFNNFKPKDGIVRNGSITIKWQLGWFFDSTKTVVVTFNNFSRDSIKLSGEITIQHTFSVKENGTIHPGHKITEKNMKLTYPDGSTMSWNGWRTVEWISGWLTRHDRTDNKLKINWHKEGTNRNGVNFTADAKDLVIVGTCHKMPVSGTITVNSDKGNFVINYGDGQCDGSYTITVNGKTTVVKP